MQKNFVKSTDAAPVSVEDLAQRINQAHEGAIRSARTAIEYAIECGRLLLEAKALVGHGSWLPWLKENTILSERTSQRWMRFSDNAERLLAKSAIDGAFAFAEADRLLAAPKPESYKTGADYDKSAKEHAEHIRSPAGEVSPQVDEVRQLATTPEEQERIAAFERDENVRSCIDLAARQEGLHRDSPTLSISSHDALTAAKTADPRKSATAISQVEVPQETPNESLEEKARRAIAALGFATEGEARRALAIERADAILLLVGWDIVAEELERAWQENEDGQGWYDFDEMGHFLLEKERPFLFRLLDEVDALVDWLAKDEDSTALMELLWERYEAHFVKQDESRKRRPPNCSVPPARKTDEGAKGAAAT